MQSTDRAKAPLVRRAHACKQRRYSLPLSYTLDVGCPKLTVHQIGCNNRYAKPISPTASTGDTPCVLPASDGSINLETEHRSQHDTYIPSLRRRDHQRVERISMYSATGTSISICPNENSKHAPSNTLLQSDNSDSSSFGKNSSNLEFQNTSQTPRRWSRKCLDLEALNAPFDFIQSPPSESESWAGSRAVELPSSSLPNPLFVPAFNPNQQTQQSAEATRCAHDPWLVLPSSPVSASFSLTSSVSTSSASASSAPTSPVSPSTPVDEFAWLKLDEEDEGNPQNTDIAWLPVVNKSTTSVNPPYNTGWLQREDTSPNPHTVHHTCPRSPGAKSGSSLWGSFTALMQYISSEEEDGKDEEDTLLSNALVKHYIKKEEELPVWLQIEKETTESGYLQNIRKKIGV